MNKIGHTAFKRYDDGYFEKFNHWRHDSEAAANEHKDIKSGIVLGAHHRLRGNSGNFSRSRMFSAPFDDNYYLNQDPPTDPVEYPFLCQVMCPDSQSSYLDFNLYQNAKSANLDDEGNSEAEDLPHTKISRDFPQAGKEILELHFNETIVNSILNHGCWCHKLDENHNDYVGGKEYVDDLDYFCKQWFTKRRCLKLNSGSCDANIIPKDKEAKYRVNNNDCEELNLNPCKRDACLVDQEMINNVNLFLEQDPYWDWQPGDSEICVKGGGKNGGEKYCAGTAPNVFIGVKDEI